MPSDKRLSNFDEVELGFSLNTAVREAQRCMNCGAGAFVDDNLCVGCLTCVRICPLKYPKLKKGTQQPTLMEIVNPVVYALWNVPQRPSASRLLWKIAVENTLETVFQEKFIQGVKPLIINFIANIAHIMRTNPIP